MDEPQAVTEYAEVLNRVAADRTPVIIRREGADLAAVVPLDYLELVQEVLMRQEAERLAEQLDWDQLLNNSYPPKSWFDGDEPKPF